MLMCLIFSMELWWEDSAVERKEKAFIWRTEKLVHDSRIKISAKQPLEILFWFSHFCLSKLFQNDCIDCSSSTGKKTLSSLKSRVFSLKTLPETLTTIISLPSKHRQVAVSEALQQVTQGICKRKKGCPNRTKLMATKARGVTYLALKNFLFWYSKITFKAVIFLFKDYSLFFSLLTFLPFQHGHHDSMSKCHIFLAGKAKQLHT